MSFGIALGRAQTLEELSASLGGTPDAQALGLRVDRLVSSAEASGPSPRASDLLVVSRARYVPRAPTKGVFLCSPQLAERLPAGRRWVHPHPLWAMAALLETIEREQDAPEFEGAAGYVSPRAVVHPSARLGYGAVVLADAVVGADTHIGPHAVIYSRTVVGARVSIGASSVVGRPGFGWAEGPDGKLRRIPQLGGVVIEDDVEVGPLCSIDAGTLGPTRICTGVRLDAHVHVGHNVTLGPETVVAAQVGFAGSATIGSGVRIGGQAGVGDHIQVGDHVSIAAKAGVVTNVPNGATVAGFPAVGRLRWLRGLASLYRRSRRP
ncbi:MAG: UDP-3-O-(3-hydroxymyristoyl)glucosamine N-acyltransferase [Polyangiaceae bacterium]|nr:UDP-3-O-(3-hydroxymyristoyl)glucosamine N-acyltransferase [Polyangiaceae bacterium]